MKINPISTIPFTKQLRIKMKSKYMTDGGYNPTPMDKVFEIADKGNHPLFIAEDVFILNSIEKFGNEASHLAGLYYFQEPSSMVAVIASNIEKEKSDKIYNAFCDEYNDVDENLIKFISSSFTGGIPREQKKNLNW